VDECVLEVALKSVFHLHVMPPCCLDIRVSKTYMW